MAKENFKVYLTRYDGFICVVTDTKVNCYEGVALCPVRIQKWLKNNEPITIDAFCETANFD